MKSSRNRKLAALLALSWVIAHPAVRAPLLLLALALDDHAAGHSFSLSLGEDARHFDLVLSHADAAGHEHGDSPACAEDSHVVHLCGDLALREAGRRHEPDAAPALMLSFALPSSPVRVRSSSHRSATPVPTGDLLGTVVLRC